MHYGMNLRDLSWRERCSLRLNARLQNWHLYFLSGTVTDVVFRGVDEADAGGGTAATLAPGILLLWYDCISLQYFSADERQTNNQDQVQVVDRFLRY